MEITINNYKVSLNKEDLIEEIERLETDVEDAHNIHGDQDEDYGVWITTGKELKNAKKSAIEFVENLTEESLKELFENTCSFTKKGLLPKNRRFVTENLGITTDYNNEHGCHSYTNAVLEFVNNEFEVELMLNYKDYQSSF